MHKTANICIEIACLVSNIRLFEFPKGVVWLTDYRLKIAKLKYSIKEMEHGFTVLSFSELQYSVEFQWLEHCTAVSNSFLRPLEKPLAAR